LSKKSVENKDSLEYIKKNQLKIQSDMVSLANEQRSSSTLLNKSLKMITNAEKTLIATSELASCNLTTIEKLATLIEHLYKRVFKVSIDPTELERILSE
jgi:hypothetical protein